MPAFVGLGTPHWEPEARGTITGITRGTTRAHLVRAALEAMAFSSAELLDAMAATGGLEVAVLRVDGGAAANDWLMQFQADTSAYPSSARTWWRRPRSGAAGLAGLALGVWASPRSSCRAAGYGGSSPEPIGRTAARRMAGWERAVGAAWRWARSGRGAGRLRATFSPLGASVLAILKSVLGAPKESA